MKDRPILFSGPMVRAILAGHKMQTRRPVRPQPPQDTVRSLAAQDGSGDHKFFSTPTSRITLSKTGWICCPYGTEGDRLWVRETWALNDVRFDRGAIPTARPADLA